MTEPSDDLLPEGLSDRLPKAAAIATQAMRAALQVMDSHGYDRVNPPLIEFEHALTGRMAKAGSSNGSANDATSMFRFVDPVSLRSLAIRSDMTVQLGRISATSLSGAPRPLRLCYAGETALIRAGQLDPMRQRLQLGAELIGNDTAAAASEIVALAIETLTAAGAQGISVDFTMPDLVDVLATDALPIPVDNIDAVRRELDTKDAGGLKSMGGAAYLPLLFATGDFDEAVLKLEQIDPTGKAGEALASRIEGLRSIARRIGDTARLTLDPTERHGFEYQSWFGFTVYADNIRDAVGRGGTYTIGGSDEVATGFSLYLDRLIDSQPVRTGKPIVYCPVGHDKEAAKKLRTNGYRTLEGLNEKEQPGELGCSHILDDAKPIEI